MNRESGLTSSEAAKRLREHGRNEIRELVHTSALRILLSQVRKNFIIYLLFGAVVISLFVGKTITAYTILGVIAAVIAVGFFQEYKADKSIKALKQMIISTTPVIRNGKEILISSAELVPGDIVLLKSGDRVPADCLVIDAIELRTNEAVLTGESHEIKKSDKIKENQLYMGTHIINGKCTASVIRTGMQTEFGKIAGMISSAEKEMPLQAKVNKIAKYMAIVAIFFSIATGLIMVSRDWPVTDVVIIEVLIVVIALSVSAFPEGFTVVLISTLATGAHRMARKNAIVNRMSIIETLGETTVICADKTGTITKGEMTVRHVFCDSKMFGVSGVGYETGGVFLKKRKMKSGDNITLDLLMKSAVLCNDASLAAGREYVVTGTPTESALMALGAKMGIFSENIASERKNEIPFSSERKMMSVLCKEGGSFFTYAKGAPEVMLKRCGHIHKNGRTQKMTTKDRKEMLELNRKLASAGLRVLCIAFKQSKPDEKHDNNLVFLGLAAMEDPPRKEVRNAIKLCRKAGIDVKMITGDHALTATAIGASMGIGDGSSALTGADLDAMDAGGLSAAVRENDIFARVSPEHKLKLVEALQSNGEVVAMTGDGVNDAPALKRADVGVAMGIKGTEVAKESAEMVLVDDNFASIMNAVEEGRTVYDNIKKSIIFILPTNGGEAGTIIAAIMSGMMLPITPVQILWVNMVTAVTLALSLAFEPPETDVMKRPPRDPDEPILSPFLVWRILFVSLILVMGTFGLFLWDTLNGKPLEEARTLAVNTLVLFEVFYLINTRYLKRSVLSMEGLFGNRYALGAIALVLFLQMLFTYLPVMQTLFGTVPIAPLDWARITLVASSVFVFVEFEKYLMARNW